MKLKKHTTWRKTLVFCLSMALVITGILPTFSYSASDSGSPPGKVVEQSSL